ncbi:DUF3592 domain-containing protein [Phytopseudomonas dryadis]|uniref:DUF3592 domain-containing protein n=1 Tax=Phytopseudomonas dryadis TaxID=2487520 RepID=A0A4Q9QZG4_9GAMM|nr:DUF3592 domain-containing protein [Pseudomonas dryadis]TBU91529.1 DUF3592 domain-containing protein [Pseudomonas dryadis]
MSSPSSNRLKASLFIFVGAVLLIIAAFQGVSRLQFIKIASTTEGRVSALNAGGSHPQIDFIDQRGEAISYAQGGFIFGYRTGIQVEVLYLRDNPANTAVVKDIGALWGAVLLFALLGTVVVY